MTHIELSDAQELTNIRGPINKIRTMLSNKRKCNSFKSKREARRVSDVAFGTADTERRPEMIFVIIR